MNERYCKGGLLQKTVMAPQYQARIFGAEFSQQVADLGTEALGESDCSELTWRASSMRFAVEKTDWGEREDLKNTTVTNGTGINDTS
jgi:hypothetical protein